MLTLRPYQTRVVNDIGDRNVVVKMPTGSGKTLVAAECVRLALLRPGNDQLRALFLAPTCDLVEQQARALRDWCTDLRVAEFKGGAAVPNVDSFDVLVSTPDAFRRLQCERSAFGWNRFGIAVFDEVHHVLKDHPYRKLANGLRAARAHSSGPQVLGLSASLTYAVGETAVQRALVGLTRDLGLEEMLCVGDDELRAGGYEPPHGEVELAHPLTLPEGVVPAEERRPHEMHKTFFGRVRRDEATPFAMKLHTVVRALEVQAGEFTSYTSPLDKPSLSAWEKYAYQLAKQRSLAAHESFFRHLENWYVALRLLVSWEEQEELVLHWLCCQKAFDVELSATLSTSATAAAAMAEMRDRLADVASQSKVACLKAQLLDKVEWARSKDTEIRAIVFVQQRITAHVLANWISADPDLRAAGLRADYVAARDATITPRLKVTPGQATDCMSRFRCGELNVLLATSVIEEGFDVPKANVVISFDPLKDSVELAQRFGRARQAERRIVAMDERRDRPIARLEQVRREQDLLIERFEPEAAAYDDAAERAKQTQREGLARQLLIRHSAGDNDRGHVQLLNEYVKKTKAATTEDCRKHSLGFIYTWTYTSPLRELRAEGRAATKKAAKAKCAANLLTKLANAGSSAAGPSAASPHAA